VNKGAQQKELKHIIENTREVVEAMRDIFGDEVLQISQNIETSETELKKQKSGKSNIAAAPMDDQEYQVMSLDDLKSIVSSCTKCALCESRTQTVFGEGSSTAAVMFIGEAPGREEDRTGEPFVGRAGQLLTKILAAINFKRDEVFIANILKCRPPKNRDPKPEEVAECEPYLITQIEKIQPKIICALGRVSANTLLKTDLSLKVLREDVHTYHGIPLIATYHPAALLRNPHWKRAAWEDVKKLRKMYEELTG